MEHSGPYGLGAGGGPTGHQNTNLKKAHGRSERCKGSGEGVRTVHGPSRHGRQWSVPTWHMEHSGPYGLGAGGGPTGHQNTNLKKAHGRSERCKREWGRGAGQCTGHRVTVDSGACQRGTWSTQDHMVWERVGGQQATRTPT
ncbi:hypothetical protein ERJ75_000585000 [Trypanosoma vivax]|nr:hypothetical protein ERJ75_000585000 [Trypanosoma vivax]